MTDADWKREAVATITGLRQQVERLTRERDEALEGLQRCRATLEDIADAEDGPYARAEARRALEELG